MRRIVALSILLLTLSLGLASCNKYGDYEVKTPVPPEPQRIN